MNAKAQSAPAVSALGFADALVSGNASARSWREKLAVVQELLADESRAMGQAELADIVSYLRFLNTGEIPCVEDGRHFRPSHHARIATRIHERLSQLATSENMFLVRRIIACLPSTAAPFQRAEPLTRIRDIAHRNDIPHDLKREIKTTLQNKLHRCAGPEDLVTSQRLLERVTAPGAHFSGDFVEQFIIFHGELTEFFNARSLEERLQALSAGVGQTGRKWIGEFLQAKQAKHESGALAILTRLRKCLLQIAESKAGAEQQELWMADIALEDYAFVLLSEILNGLSAASSPRHSRAQIPGKVLLEQILCNLQLSQIAPAEVAVTQNEVSAALSQLNLHARDSLLRLKAAVERARRLAGEFGDTVLANLAERAQVLGQQLGVAPHASRVFAEAEVRGHLVFQLAKLATEMLRSLRQLLHQPPWDVIVAGRTAGRLVSATRLGELNGISESLIVALAEAEGDEEIPDGVSGILLAHELPHLSHLGVRARQAGVVVACCEEKSLWADSGAKVGGQVELVAGSEGVQITPAKVGAATKNAPKRLARAIPQVQLQTKAVVLPLEKAGPASGGNKSDGARRLLEFSQRRDAGFSAPDGLVVPFGVMELCLQADARIHGEYQSLVARVNKLDAAEFAAALEKIRQWVMQVKVPDPIVAAVVKKFGRSQALAVRSSANSEDLADLAGAGLHESVAGVTAAELEVALKTVWASLWTERAAASRRQAGIPHEAAHMAVLIQPLIEPELSFFLHTVNPLNHRPGECYVELAVGLGETLASAAVRGTPYRMVCDREQGSVMMLAFANFSHALFAGAFPSPGLPAPLSPSGRLGGFPLGEHRVDYSQVRFTSQADLRANLGARLAQISNLVEREFGAPQDVEGVIRGDEIILVQSRAQQGIPPTT